LVYAFRIRRLAWSGRNSHDWLWHYRWRERPACCQGDVRPTFGPDSEVAFVAFLEFLDAPMPGAAGSQQDLQQKLIRELAAASASSWPKPQLAS